MIDRQFRQMLDELNRLHDSISMINKMIKHKQSEIQSLNQSAKDIYKEIDYLQELMVKFYDRTKL
jgi:peptidoglycan hydrolase CwlO-like protein